MGRIEWMFRSLPVLLSRMSVRGLLRRSLPYPEDYPGVKDSEMSDLSLNKLVWFGFGYG